jgi:hypothetical protein
MGLLNKLKNVLFEEEEIEEVVEEPKPKVKPVSKSTMELPKITKETKKEKYDVEQETDRELFKAEKTFDFPAFDEEEFEEFAPQKKEEPIKTYERDTYERKVINNYNKPIRKSEYTSTRIVKKTAEEPKKVFKPSPVISPVYGVLDKNYKKEDVLTREEVVEKKNVKLDVDSVRKKAFGTLEEDLAATLTEPIETFYEEPTKEEVLEDTTELDNLLENTVDVEIDVTKEMEIPSRLEKNNYEEPVKEEIQEEFSEEEVEEKKVEDTEIKNEVTDDTIENDLFELIDSMYENREDE